MEEQVGHQNRPLEALLLKKLVAEEDDVLPNYVIQVILSRSNAFHAEHDKWLTEEAMSFYQRNVDSFS